MNGVRVQLPIVLGLLVCGTAGGCPQDRNPDVILASVAGDTETFGPVVAVGTNDFVYWLGEFGVRVLDATDPRDTFVAWEREHGLQCRSVDWIPDVCGVAISGTSGFASVNSQLSRVNMASSGEVSWVLDGVGGGAPMLVSGAIASGPFFQVSIVVDSGGTPAVVAEVSDSTIAAETYGDSLYVTTLDTKEFIALDLADPASPIEYARIALPISFSERITAAIWGDTMSFVGSNLFALTSEDPYEACRVTWMSIDTANGTAVVEGRSDTYRGCLEILATDGYVVLAYDWNSRRRVDVLRVGPPGIFTRTGRVQLGGDQDIVDIALDSRRGLLYVARARTLDVLDFGLLTTGEPSVP